MEQEGARPTEIDDRDPNQVQPGEEKIGPVLKVGLVVRWREIDTRQTYSDTGKHDGIDKSGHADTDGPTSDSKAVALCS